MKDSWDKVAPDLDLKKQLISILGLWEFSKLTGVMDAYKAFDQEFFKRESERFRTQLPEDSVMEFFVIFLNNFACALMKNNEVHDSEFVLRISIKIKNENNPAHFSLVAILYDTGRYEEALKEAKIAFEIIEDLESQLGSLPSDYKTELELGNDLNIQKQSLEEIIRKIEISRQ